MNSVKNAGLMNNSSITIFAENYLAIIVPTSNPANITSLSDLAKSGVKLDIANSSVPVGNYSLQMLAKASNNSTYGSSFKNSVLANVVSEETNVNDVVAKVALGQADAGIVYKSDVPAAYQSKVQVIAISSQCERPCPIPNRGSQQFVERSTGAEFHKLCYLS